MKKAVNMIFSVRQLTATCLLLVAAMLTPVRSAAASTPWQETAGGRLRITGYQKTEAGLAVDKVKDAKAAFAITGVIDIELKPGWHTYWRNPGSSGMAPEITLDQKGEGTILFPAPRLLIDGEQWTFGYEGHVMLPFRVEKQQGTLLSGSVMIGLCKTICLPETLLFQFDLQKPADILAQGQINAALAALPAPERADFRITSAMTDADGKQLSITLQHPKSVRPPQIFLAEQTLQPAIAQVDHHTDRQTHYHVPIMTEQPAGESRILHYVAVLENGEAVTGTVTVRP